MIKLKFKVLSTFSKINRFSKALFATKDTMNQYLIEAEYQVRGKIAIKSSEYMEKMKQGEKFKFEKIYQLNIGNPQALDQKPITFPRQVLSCLFKKRLGTPEAKDRVDNYLSEIHSVDQYTDYRGMSIVRSNVAEFINQRDETHTCTKDDIMLTNGAGGGIKLVLETLVNSKTDSIMIPIPQYPLYTALIKLYGCNAAGYYLDEENGWSLNVNELEDVYEQETAKGNTPKAFVVINPGNPTGNLLSKLNITEIIKFCYDHGLVILADEVYQENVYNPKKKFFSFRKVLETMPYPYRSTTIFSFHSVSKGVFGECGMRGGYFDMANVPFQMNELIQKLKILDVCPNIAGQVICDVMVKPPKYEDSSKDVVDLFNKEKNDIFQNLKIKANILSEELNNIPGFSCQKIDGAMYAFPKIDIPEWRIKEAKSKGVHPDAMFCLSLLDNTGITAVPGSGFGQKEGTHHIRLTNLINPKEEMIEMTKKMKKFCEEYFKQGSKL